MMIFFFAKVEKIVGFSKVKKKIAYICMSELLNGMNKRNRECPHCHETVSLWRCVDYKLYDGGKGYRTRCNHCGRNLIIRRDSLNFWSFILVWLVPYVLVTGAMYLLPELPPFWVVPTVYIVLTVLTTWLYIAYVSRKIEFEKPTGENERTED